jgi:hypothetical protein
MNDKHRLLEFTASEFTAEVAEDAETGKRFAVDDRQ